MARIEEYEAKDVKLTPSDKGYAAVELAARRVGSLYQQMAAGQRELGNLTKASDEAIGRTTEAFLRFQGLSQQASGTGVKVDKGGAGERTLLGTGAGGDTSWNARANASNDLTEKVAKRTTGTGTGETADQAAQKAVDKDTAALKATQAADQLKASRDAEDEQRKGSREAQDASRAEELDNWNLTHPNDPLANQMKVTFNLEADRVKAQRLIEDEALKQSRNAQDAAIKEGKSSATLYGAQLNYQGKADVANAAAAYSKAARDMTGQLNPTQNQQDYRNAVTVLRGNDPAAQAKLINVPAPGEETGGRVPGHTGEDTSTDTVPEALPSGAEAAQPTYTGDVPAIPPSQQQQQASQQDAGSQAPTGGEEQYMPPTRDQSQIQSPLDNQDVPGLYSDLWGGMP